MICRVKTLGSSEHHRTGSQVSTKMYTRHEITKNQHMQQMQGHHMEGRCKGITQKADARVS